jgi:dienelactone hydrolase
MSLFSRRPPRLQWRSSSALLVAVAALLALAAAVWHFTRAFDTVSVTRFSIGQTPATLFVPASPARAPVVVIAHGFAGSQQLMQPFALTLARNGYIALSFDFPGHGANPQPLAGGASDEAGLDASTRALLAALGEVVAYAHTLAQGDGRLALVGHSMASDIVIRYAREHPEVGATVAASAFSKEVTPLLPKNLLVIYGALEPAMLLDQGREMVAQAAPGTPLAQLRERETFGDFADGSARRLVLSAGVEHIGVLYSRETLGETVAWLNRAFNRADADPAFVDARAGAIGLLYLGLLLLAWPLSRLLPQLSPVPQGASLSWREAWPVIVLPALATPLLLAHAPPDLLPLLLGGYLVQHFAVYALLSALGLLWVERSRRRQQRESVIAARLLRLCERVPGFARRLVRNDGVAVRLAVADGCAAVLPLGAGATPAVSATAAIAAATAVPVASATWPLLLAIVASAAYSLFAIGLPTGAWVSNFIPDVSRAPLIGALLLGTLPFFVIEEWATRGAGARRGLVAASRIAFLVSLMLAVAVNASQLFFLVIIIPVILVLFLVYGLFSEWAYRRTGQPLVGAIASALSFAWLIAVSFPVMLR